jgi:hypothetical protein
MLLLEILQDGDLRLFKIRQNRVIDAGPLAARLMLVLCASVSRFAMAVASIVIALTR